MIRSQPDSAVVREPARLLCIEFEPDIGPARLASCLESLGADVHVVRVHGGDRLPNVTQYDGVIPLGGTMNAEDDAHYPSLGETVSLLRVAARRRIPVLGICLGAQLLARSLGARIWRKSRMEVGYFPVQLTAAGRRDPLFAGFADVLLTFQWHEDAFDLPPGAALLAMSDRDTAQVFKLGSCYGVQFHPEVTEESVSSWCTATPAVLATAASPTTREALLERARETELEFAAQTAMLCENWLRIVAAAPGRTRA